LLHLRVESALDECFDIAIENANRPKNTDTFIQLIGKKTKNIKMDGVDLTEQIGK
jgi:hypothetical protein